MDTKFTLMAYFPHVAVAVTVADPGAVVVHVFFSGVSGCPDMTCSNDSMILYLSLEELRGEGGVLSLICFWAV